MLSNAVTSVRLLHIYRDGADMFNACLQVGRTGLGFGRDLGPLSIACKHLPSCHCICC